MIDYRVISEYNHSKLYDYLQKKYPNKFRNYSVTYINYVHGYITFYIIAYVNEFNK